MFKKAKWKLFGILSGVVFLVLVLISLVVSLTIHYKTETNLKNDLVRIKERYIDHPAPTINTDDQNDTSSNTSSSDTTTTDDENSTNYITVKNESLSSDTSNSTDSETPNDNGNAPSGNGGSKHGEMKDDRILPRFLIVQVEDDGTFTIKNSEGLQFGQQESFNEKLTLMANSSSESGRLDYFYYLRAEKDSLTYLVVVDAMSELTNVETVTKYTTIITATSFGILTIACYFISSYAFVPYERLYEKEKTFITNASHELKTPLTIIQTNCEVMEAEGYTSTWLDSTKDQTKRMSKLVTSLVTLTKLDEQKSVEKNDIILSEALSEAVLPYQSQAITKKIDFSTNIQEDIHFVGDLESLGKLFSVLLDNMMKYTPEGGKASISLHKSKKEITLLFENSCEEMTSEKTEHMFDRFYTGSSSRDKKTSGFGIGLSIAKQAVSLNDGNIKAYSKDSNFLTIEINFKS